MKRTKATSGGDTDKHLKPSKKPKPGITFDDQTLSDVAQVKEVSSPAVGQTESSSRGKRMLVKRNKSIESNSPVSTSERKKRRSLAYSRGAKALPKGGKGDLVKITTPKIVEKEHVAKELGAPITCVMGLQCKAVTDAISQSKKLKLLSTNPPKVVESEMPEALPKLVPDEANGGTGTTVKRKRGRPFKSQVKSPKTPLAVNHENGKKVPVTEKKRSDGPQQKKNMSSPVPNTSSGKRSTGHLEKYQSLKGKRGKRRKISSINTVSSPQGGQDSSWKQKANGGLENEHAEVEKSADTTISDDQPLSRWFEGMQSASGKRQIEGLVGVRNREKLSFEKRSTLWATLEAMELFQMIPQKPHFRPLDDDKECTREGHAISKMVTYLRVVEAAAQLTLEHPRSAYDENLEVLVELEAHGFDVEAVRGRLRELLLVKEKREGLEEEAEKVKEKMEAERAEGQRMDTEIESVDQQVVALLEKRAQVLKRKEKKDAQVGLLEAQVDAINQDMSQLRCKFDGLAAASLCVSQEQTPPLTLTCS